MKRRKLFYETAKARGLARLLFEEEEEETTEEEPEEAPEDAEGEEAEGDDAEGEEGEEGDEEEEPEMKPFSIDNELEALLIKAEEEAKTSAKTAAASVESKSIEESKRRKSIKVLYEAPEEQKMLDVDHFANRVARIVKNYDSLIDMEQLILKRANEFLEAHYDADVVSSFQDALRQMHGLELMAAPLAPGSKLGVPNAVGARQATA
jgi:hypothetical protein